MVEISVELFSILEAFLFKRYKRMLSGNTFKLNLPDTRSQFQHTPDAPSQRIPFQLPVLNKVSASENTEKNKNTPYPFSFHFFDFVPLLLQETKCLLQIHTFRFTLHFDNRKTERVTVPPNQVRLVKDLKTILMKRLNGFSNLSCMPKDKDAYTLRY